MSDHPSPSRMPSAATPLDAPPGRPEGPWGTAALVLLAVWSVFFAGAVLLWVRLAFFRTSDEDPHGYITLFGAPFVLVALGLLWWAWRSAGALRQGRREGFTLLLVLGGVAVAQTVMTSPALVGGTVGPGTPGVEPSAPPREMVLGLLVAVVLGLASVVVGWLGRRAWAPASSEEPAGSADPATEDQADPRP